MSAPCAVLSWSSGKDCAFALNEARRLGLAEVVALLADLPPGIDPCGENGEFHTAVVAGPMFSAPIAVAPGEVVTRQGFVYADLMLA